VLVVHEWWGHNEHARNRARMLAEMGYIALAVDMYGDGKTANHPKDAGGFAGVVRNNLPLARERFEAALSTLQQDPHTDKSRIGAIGFCFGGAVVLEMARLGLDLKGVASFHGSLGTDQPAKKGVMKAQVLVLTGADDPMVKADTVEAFKKEMKAAGVKYDVVSYKGVKHSFTNPDADKFAKEFDMPVAYDKKADTDSWKRLGKFLKKVFK
jgi:dienelactone hydrolase